MATAKKTAKAAPSKTAKAAPKKATKSPVKAAVKKVSAPVKPVIEKVVSKKATVIAKQTKSVKKQIQEKLTTALSAYISVIGDKKFHSLAKKASKSFSAEIQKANKDKEKKAEK